MGFNSTDSTYSETQLQKALDTSEAKINKQTNNKFLDGTAATPNYTQVTEEKHRGKGAYNRDYFADKYPLANVSTLLNGAVVAEDTTITVDSTQGFSSSGHIFIGSDKIAYTGKDATNFTGCTGVLAHDDNDKVNSYGFEISTTSANSTPVWNVLSEIIEYDVELTSGRFYTYQERWIADPQGSTVPPKLPNRARLTYLTGRTSIPDDIEWLCKAMASRDLMRAAVRKATAQGMNEFSPELLDVDSEEIKRIMMMYKSYQMSNI